MLRTRSMLLLLLVGLLAPTPSHAATTHTIEIWNGHFFPHRITAAAGDTIQFVNRGSAGHRVASYAGQSFDSGAAPTMQTYETFIVPDAYDGSEIAYRDLGNNNYNQPNSTLNGTACTGMCGSITITAPALPPSVTIASPANGSTLTSNTVVVSGSAPNANIVRVTKGTSALYQDRPVDGSGQWSYSDIFSNGPATVSVRAYNSIEGWASAASTVSFTVTAGDVSAPTIALYPLGRISGIGQPAPAKVGQIEVGMGAIDISAIVEDDVSVASVTAKVTNLATQIVTDVVLSCQTRGGSSLNCAATSGPYVRAIAKHYAGAGYYKVEVVATDAATNRTSKSGEIVIISPV